MVLPIRLIAAGALCFAAADATTAVAQGGSLGSSFSYQGYLADGTQAVDATADLRFRLYDAPVGGALLGTDVADDLVIENGIVRTELDFGPGIIDGDSVLYLEIGVDVTGQAVETANESLYTMLGSRVAILPVPFAMNADLLDGKEASEFDQSITNELQDLELTGSQLNISGGAGVDLAPLLAGVPDGHSLDAQDGSPGDVVFVDGEGNVGVGTAAPGTKLDVDGSVIVRGGDLRLDQENLGIVTDRLNQGIFQTFLAGESGSVPSLAIFLFGSQTAPGVLVLEVSLYEGVGIDGTRIAVEPVNLTLIPDDGFVNVPFDTPGFVEAGQEYTIGLKWFGGPNPAGVVGITTTDDYPDGQMFQFSGGSYNPLGGEDLIFRTFVSRNGIEFPDGTIQSTAYTGPGPDLVDDADADPTNERITGMQLSGTQLSINEGGSVWGANLASLIDDADPDPLNEFQGLSFSFPNLTLSDGGGTVNLSSLINDADASASNEIQALSFSNPFLSLSKGGGTVDLSPLRSGAMRTYNLSGFLADRLDATQRTIDLGDVVFPSDGVILMSGTGDVSVSFDPDAGLSLEGSRVTYSVRLQGPETIDTPEFTKRSGWEYASTAQIHREQYDVSLDVSYATPVTAGAYSVSFRVRDSFPGGFGVGLTETVNTSVENLAILYIPNP